jgi:hypothetical protein
MEGGGEASIIIILYNLKIEIFMAVKIQMLIFGLYMLRNTDDINQCFRGTYNLQLHFYLENINPDDKNHNLI